MLPDLSGILPFREATLLAALLHGSGSVLAPDVRGWMTGSGSAYLVGMYGFKLHILSEAVTGLLGAILSRRLSIAIAACAVLAFVVAIGSPPSAVRAGSMVSIAAAAELTDRRIRKWSALAATALLMIAAQPALAGSSAFALTFASLAGIYALSPRFIAMLPGTSRGFADWKFHVAASAAVNLAILPIVAALDGSFPLISFVSNACMGIPLGAILSLGVIAEAADLVLPAAARIIAAPLGILLSYELLAARLFSMIPVALPASLVSGPAAFVYYGILAFIALKRRT